MKKEDVREYQREVTGYMSGCVVVVPVVAHGEWDEFDCEVHRLA